MTTPTTLADLLPAPPSSPLPNYSLPDGLLSGDLPRAESIAWRGADRLMVRWGRVHGDQQTATDYRQSAVDILHDLIAETPPASWIDLHEMAQMAGRKAYAAYLRHLRDRQPVPLPYDLPDSGDRADDDDDNLAWWTRGTWQGLIAQHPPRLETLIRGIHAARSIADIAAHAKPPRSTASLYRDLADLRRYDVSRLARLDMYQLAVVAGQSVLS